MRLLFCFAGLISLVVGSFTGCAGYINIPEKNIVSLKDIKVQLFADGSSKPVAETEVAPKSGFFHVSYDKLGKVSVRLVYPDGWVFDKKSIELDVDGETDLCSLNEDLTFTFMGLEYTGAILSEGSDIGPSGVTVRLQSADGDQLEVLTGENGVFNTEKPILPGNYQLSASHDSFSISDPVDLELTTDTNLVNLPVITGYQVTGSIEETGHPVHGVTFMISLDGEVLQTVLSDNTGRFVFDKVKAGSYMVEAEYKTDQTKFTVEPVTQSIMVSNGNHELPNAFVVTGLNVFGTVSLKNGLPVKGAVITLDAKHSAVADDEGSFEISGIKPGEHQVHVTMEKLEFESMNVVITSEQPVLPVLTPIRMSLCAQVKDASGRLELYSGDVKMDTSSTSEHCFLVPSGDYRIRPITTMPDMHFTPVEQEIVVGDEPVDGVVFTQFTRPFEAFVNCLDECRDIAATLTSVATGKGHALTIDSGSDSNLIRRLAHSALNPGDYDLTVTNDGWCFDAAEPSTSTTVRIEIASENKPVPEPVSVDQKSFLLQIRSDYDTNVEIVNGEQATTEPVQVGLNKYCVNAIGRYELTPISCHVFEEAQYYFDTTSPQIIELKANEHQQIIRVEVDEALSTGVDIKLMVNDDQLNTDMGYSNGFLNFAMNVKQNAQLVVEPKSGQLFIHPTSFSSRVSFGSDGCLKPIEFQALEGLFVRGSITPPVELVQIDITCESDSSLHLNTASNSAGEFSLGPLDPHKNYNINPMHQNYRFVRSETKGRYDYEAEQLANLRITVKDLISAKAVSDVRIILSGPNRFRSILTIDASGDVAFPRLEPGDYFVIFEKKEYNFTPNKVELNLTGNEHLEVSADRFQFSAFGKLTSLSNTAFPNYKVEATGKSDSCVDHVQEARTDEDGNFKMLGLTQDCIYDIKVHPSGDYLISPDRHQVRIAKSDVKEIEFTAFKVITQTRISGNVAICPTCPLKGITAHLFATNSNGGKILPAKEIITLTEDSGTFFNFKKIAQDGKNVLIELNTPDDNQSHQILADKPHKHVTFVYETRSDPLSDLDKTHGQLGAALLILVLIVSTLVTQREKILNVFASSRGQTSGDGIERGTTKGATKGTVGRRNR